MDAEPDVSRVARTIGDPTRIRMLTLLMAGRALTAKELAHGARIGPATATAHLRRLLDDSLVDVTAQGRHKYFRLASPDVAHCVEALLVVAVPAEPPAPGRLQPVHHARFCYDHLAGRLAVEMTETLLKRDVLRLEGRGFEVSKKGARWFTDFGLDLKGIATVRRKFAPMCLDWSERKHHLGGALGAAVAERMLAAGWVRRKSDTRVAMVTPLGRETLAAHFGIKWESALLDRGAALINGRHLGL